MTAAATFMPTVGQAREAGFFPSRHTVEIVDNRMLADGVYRLTFRDEFIAGHAKPAQFVDVYSNNPSRLMPRPFGVAEVDGDEVSLYLRRRRQRHRRILRIACGRHHSGDGSSRQLLQHQGERELRAGGRRSRRAAAGARRAGHRRIGGVDEHRGVRIPQRAFRRRIRRPVRGQDIQHRRIRRQCRNAP